MHTKKKLSRNKGVKSAEFNEFQIAQCKFDMLKCKERKYYRDKYDMIEKTNTSNPREFWSRIKSLGPVKRRNIPEQVEINNVLVSDIDQVLNKWKSDFNNLYNKPERAKEFYDMEFYDSKIEHLKFLEQHCNSSNDSNQELNFEITKEEVSKVLAKLKDNKATGVDLIKNEILKFKNEKFNIQIIPSLFRNR